MQVVRASEIAERAETLTISPSRGAKCSFTMSPQVRAGPAHGPSLWAPKFTENCTCARSVCKGARESAPERKKTDLWGAKGAKSGQKGV